ncbi:MAG: hypothetical protein N3D17_03430 [bacterium]|nr:hypothetical protein [bacterium]
MANIDILMWNLKEKGKEISRQLASEEELKSIDNIAFRLLEQIRLENKDNVFYILLRWFKTNGKKFPEELIEAFKPENEIYFKTLLFSFLAPILTLQKNIKEEQNED